jgi:cysteine desulfurase family protein
MSAEFNRFIGFYIGMIWRKTMKSIYADNAATTFPKPEVVGNAVCNYIQNIGTNVGRGTYQSAYDSSRVVYETRELLCNIFKFDNPSNVIFTMNITESLNILIKGMLRPGDHVIISSMEHNAVIRPLNSPLLQGIEITKLQCTIEGYLNPFDIEKNIKENTKLVILTHASNVCGTILPIKEIGSICKKRSIAFFVDTAQTAGILPIDMTDYNISALAFTGHKGLMGPQGIGGFILSEGFENKIHTLIEGGTGSFSESEIHPDILPDKFESGTMNIPGIYGLNAAIKFINSIGMDVIRNKEEELSRKFLNNILNIEGVKLSGLHKVEGRTAVFSINFDNIDNSEAGFILDRDYGIMTRVGLHCAPSAHKTLNTFPSGSVRFSFGYFNTMEDIDYISNALQKLAKQ